MQAYPFDSHTGHLMDSHSDNSGFVSVSYFV